VTAFLEQLESWILALAASAWVHPAMFGFATIDGFFPPLPSESVVITLTVSAHATGTPWLPGILVMAAIGAWCGDQIAYAIGKGIGTDRIPFLRTRRGRKAVAWARRALLHRGASLILAARYVPVGRVAVNMTAGAVAYPRRRFMVFSAIAAVTWAIYSMLIGLAAASWLGHDPLLAMAAGVVAGVVIGFLVDQLVQLLTRRRMAEIVAAERLAMAGGTAEVPSAGVRPDDAPVEECPEPCPTAEATAGVDRP
jgi:membrane protein DedA with SNARE-associated domain